MTGVNNDLPTFGTVDDLSYFYTGNQLNIVNDQGTLDYGFKDIPSGSKEYYYDANGNMTEDKNKGIIIEYNHINLPTKVTFVNQYKSIEWTYDAAGIKLEKKTIFGNNINTKDYIGGIEYANDKIEAVYHEEGRIVAKDSDVDLSDGTTTLGVINWEYEYSLSDHLGNSRVMFSDLNEDGVVDVSEVLQVQAYYPFGLVHEGAGSQQIGAQNKYQYNGKELNDDFGLGWSDYGARWYMADLGRWGAVDPLAEKAYDWSPYRYGFNNPMLFVDPDGKWEVKFGGDGKLSFMKEDGDNKKTLARQLGISKKEAKGLLKSESGENGEYKFESNEIVSNINSYLRSEGMMDTNCQTCGIDLETPRNGFDTAEGTGVLAQQFENVDEAQTSIGDVITFTNSESEAVDKGLPKDYYKNDKQHTKESAHYGTVLLKTKDGKKVSQIFEKPGQEPPNITPAKYYTDPGQKRFFDIYPTTGNKTSYHKKKKN